MFEELEKILNYNFNDKKLLKEALTHPSTSYNNRKIRFNYERLEFLGDSVLSCVIVNHLFKEYKNETEGQLSKRKAFLISKNTLSFVSNNLKIGDFMILSNGEESNGGRTNRNNLENVLEAIIGAIFLDSNFETTMKFVIDIWEKFVFEQQVKGVPLDPKSELQEWTQKHFKKLPEYNLLESSAPSIFNVELKIPEHQSIIGTGHSIKEIEIRLAKEMLENIKYNI